MMAEDNLPTELDSTLKLDSNEDKPSEVWATVEEQQNAFWVPIESYLTGKVFDEGAQAEIESHITSKLDQKFVCVASFRTKLIELIQGFVSKKTDFLEEYGKDSSGVPTLYERCWNNFKVWDKVISCIVDKVNSLINSEDQEELWPSKDSLFELWTLELFLPIADTLIDWCFQHVYHCPNDPSVQVAIIPIKETLVRLQDTFGNTLYEDKYEPRFLAYLEEIKDWYEESNAGFVANVEFVRYLDHAEKIETKNIGVAKVFLRNDPPFDVMANLADAFVLPFVEKYEEEAKNLMKCGDYDHLRVVMKHLGSAKMLDRLALALQQFVFDDGFAKLTNADPNNAEENFEIAHQLATKVEDMMCKVFENNEAIAAGGKAGMKQLLNHESFLIDYQLGSGTYPIRIVRFTKLLVELLDIQLRAIKWNTPNVDLKVKQILDLVSQITDIEKFGQVYYYVLVDRTFTIVLGTEIREEEVLNKLKEYGLSQKLYERMIPLTRNFNPLFPTYDPYRTHATPAELRQMNIEPDDPDTDYWSIMNFSGSEDSDENGNN